MNNLVYVNPIDTLDKLLNVENDNQYADIGYFKLWIKTVLEQRDGDFGTLDIISARLSAKFKKPDGNGNVNNTIDEYVLAAVLRYICKRESLKWHEAFNALEDTYGYLEYCNIDPAYVLYLVGRLFYDIQEYYEDYIHIRTEFTNNIIDNTNSHSFERKFDYINKVRVENCIRALLPPNIDYKVPEKIVATKDILDIAELFFENAYKQKTKEHYVAWLALTKQKKGIYYFYQYAMLREEQKHKEAKENYEYAKDEFGKAILQYERTIEIANKNINYLLFNIGLCFFYQEMMDIYFENTDAALAYENCTKAVMFLSKAISAKDESNVKSEYTFRRNPLDVYYYRLLAIFEFVKNSGGKTETRAIRVFDENILNETLNELHELLEEEKFEPYQRVEYYITMAKIKEYLVEKEFVINDDISPSSYWDKAKFLDEIKFNYPYRIGLAFSDKKYTKKWSDELSRIKHNLNVDTSSDNCYVFYQNSEIKEHFKEMK